MSWLSELKWSNRDEHIDAMLTGDAELDESVVSTYDRPQGFKFKLAQRLAAGLLPTVGANDKGKTLQTNETTGAPEWSEASGGGGVTVVTVTKQNSEAKGGDTKAQPIFTYVADKTVAEIQAAALTGSVVFQVVKEIENQKIQIFTLADVMPNGINNYDVEIGGHMHSIILGAEIADDYPTAELSE